DDGSLPRAPRRGVPALRELDTGRVCAPSTRQCVPSLRDGYRRVTTTSFYDGIIGTVYAAAIANQHFVEDDVFTRLVAEAGGTSLELGSGTGRLMLRLLASGYDVEGLEISDEMIDVCFTEASRLGLRPVVHRGSFAPLDESLRGYAAIYCPLNAFSF